MEQLSNDNFDMKTLIKQEKDASKVLFFLIDINLLFYFIVIDHLLTKQ